MFQTDQATAAASLPTPAAAGTTGYFTNGNPGTGVAATILDADFMNMIMMELSNVVTSAGIAPSKTTYTQVRDAIKRIGQNTVVLADTGAVNAYTAVNGTPLVSGTWVDGVIQAVKIAHTNTGASTYAPDGLTAIPIYGLGLQPLQGGELALNGTAVLMHATIPGVNSGNPIAVLMECAGGAQQIPPATQSGHAVQMAQAAGVVGSVRNLVIDIPSASASATATADEIIVETALGGIRYCLPSFSKSINIGTVGAGGMDVAGLPATAQVAVYAIYNPTTGASALLGWNATSKAPEVYGGGALPSGYTASCLLTVLLVQSSQFIVSYVQDRHVTTNQINQLNTSTSSASNVSLVLGCPLNSKSVDLASTFSSTSATNANVAIASASTGLLNVRSYPVTAGQFGSMQLSKHALRTAQTIWYSISNSAGTPQTIIALVGYDI